MGIDIMAYTYKKDSSFRPMTKDIYEALSELDVDEMIYVEVEDLPKLKKKLHKEDYQEISEIVEETGGCYFRISY